MSSSSIWCHPVISSDIWFPLCKGKIHASTSNNLKYPRFFDAFSLYSVFSVWTAQMEIGGMFRRDAEQNAPLLRHKTKGKSRIMNQNQAKEYYKKIFVNYPDVLSVEEATTLLGFKSQTAIIRRIHQHRIRCLKVGRSFMIPKEYLIDYLLDSYIIQPLYYIAHHFSIRKECAFYFKRKAVDFLNTSWSKTLKKPHDP